MALSKDDTHLPKSFRYIDLPTTDIEKSTLDKKTKKARLAPGIHQSKEIRDILHACTFNTVLLFDFDSTLARPAKAYDLGSEHWFKEFYEAVKNELKEDEDIWQQVLPVLDEALEHVSVKPVEEIIKTIIPRLREMGLPIYIITSRGVRLDKITERQAKEVGINLPETKAHAIELPEGKKIAGKIPVCKNNIIYCDGINKGHCAEAYFKQMGIELDHVVMVDNTERHLHNTETQVKANGGTFTGIHYVHLTEREENFEMKKAGEKLMEIYDKFTPETQAKVRRFEKILGLSVPKQTEHAKPSYFKRHPNVKNALIGLGVGIVLAAAISIPLFLVGAISITSAAIASAAAIALLTTIGAGARKIANAIGKFTERNHTNHDHYAYDNSYNYGTANVMKQLGGKRAFSSKSSVKSDTYTYASDISRVSRQASNRSEYQSAYSSNDSTPSTTPRRRR